MRKLAITGILALSLMTWAAFAAAGPGCGSKAAKAGCAATCLTKTATKGCNHSAKDQEARQAMFESIEVATTRLPSGALLVLYTSDDAKAVETLQTSAATGAEGFDCRLCQKIAGDSNCTIELGMLENGIVAFVVSEDATVVDTYEKQFAAMIEPEGESRQ